MLVCLAVPCLSFGGLVGSICENFPMFLNNTNWCLFYFIVHVEFCKLIVVWPGKLASKPWLTKKKNKPGLVVIGCVESE